jgi:hypothetical protein
VCEHNGEVSGHVRTAGHNAGQLRRFHADDSGYLSLRLFPVADCQQDGLAR